MPRTVRRPVDRAARVVVDCLEARLVLASVAAADNAAPVIHALQNVGTIARTKRSALTAANANLFKAATALSRSANGATDHVQTAAATPFTLDFDTLRTTLARAPAEFTQGATDIPVILAVPSPDGSFQRFKVVRSLVMDPALARQFPSIRTYRGVGIDDPTADIRLDTTDAGFHAQVLSPGGAYYIDPYFASDARGTYVAYARDDAARSTDFDCHVLRPDGASANLNDTNAAADSILETSTGFQSASITYAGTLKTYRAAVGANHQYASAVGGSTVSGTQAAIVTAMNRVTGVYETELSIRLVLVANNSNLIYTSTSGDPWTSNDDTVIDHSTDDIDGVIGSANYDIGHVFTTGSGGVAFLGVVGDATYKGGGTTGKSNPTGDPFYIDYVAHEMGHQFGAEHSFNTSLDPNRNASTAYEPGSGVSIMAYAGLEGNDDLESHSIPYFHSTSIDEIRGYIGTVPGVGTSTSNGNIAPVVNAGADYIIPANTPFALTATGSDANGDTLTYDWQERDLGAARTLNQADNGLSPLFRVFSPTISPTRTFPKLSSILSGLAVSGNYAGNTTYAGERLPTVARSAMNFRVIARDNRAGGGGVSTDDMKVQVVASTGFLINSFNTASTIAGGSTQTLTWTVGGTTASPVLAANVNILMSLDNGNTFTTLLANTPNDGTQAVQFPYGVGSSQMRLKVQPTNNIFFDINNAALTLTNVAVPASATPATPVLTAPFDSGVSSSDRVTNFNGSALSLSVGSTAAGALVELVEGTTVIGSATATGTTTLIPLSATLSEGAHVITARQTESGKPVSTASATVTITIDTVSPAAPASPDLDAASDSGISSSDNLTNDATPSLTFNTTDTYVRLTRDGAPISGDYATTLTFTDTTLADGPHTYAAQAVDAAGNVSASTLLVVTIDTVGPTLAAPTQFDFETAQTLRYTFNESVAPALDPERFQIERATGGNAIPIIDYNDTTHIATLHFATNLPDGNYTASVSGLIDPAGNLAADSLFDFYVLAGDFNRDRTVNFDDLLTLSQNYDSSGKTFSTGDTNYDGVVNFDDLLALSQNYGMSLAATAAPTLAAAAQRHR